MTLLIGLNLIGYFVLILWSFAGEKIRRPVNLQVYRCGASIWQMFRQYHYLNGKLGAGVRCYLSIYNEKPVAFMAVACIRMKAKYYRVSRLVVQPDFQGIGVGKRFLNFIAELYSSQTKLPFYILTSNPQIIRGGMKNWKVTRFGYAGKGQGDTRINNEIRPSLSRKPHNRFPELHSKTLSIISYFHTIKPFTYQNPISYFLASCQKQLI
jgi:GNAT superfamily N-acetyltransferase